MPEKCCRMCSETKPLDEYPNRADAQDGKRNECKRCLVKRTSGRDRSDYNKVWREKNADRLREYDQSRPPRADAAGYHARYRAENFATVIENERRYRRRNRHKEAARRHARRSLSPLTDIDRDYIAVVQADPCSYCGGPGGTVDHIRAVTRGGDNRWQNFTGACLSCNSSKKTRDLLQFMLSRC